MISRKTADRSQWTAIGPWTNEPDTAVWLETEFLLPCLMDRMDWGSLNGYVGIPPEHKFHSRGHDDIPVDVHGGLTYAGDLYDTHLFDGLPLPLPLTSYWWVGFDTGHHSDLQPNFPIIEMRQGTYRTFDYVVSEIKSLAAQIAGGQHPLEYLARLD